MSREQPGDVPTAAERQGGKPLGDAEAREKGPWAARADEGIAPTQPGPSDGEREPAEDGELGASVVGVTTGSDEPATTDGVDLTAGDNADATTDGGPTVRVYRARPSPRSIVDAFQARRAPARRSRAGTRRRQAPRGPPHQLSG
jgi:hypothetical protein